MDSFYGGKPGVGFVLKARFDSVQAMVTSFKQGSSYNGVWYGEFCVIDTPNKNHRDNGKIYRRGLEYQNSMGGAEYIGQFVGPSSGTPYFQMNTISEAIHQAEIDHGENSYKRYPKGYQTDELGRVIGYDISEDGDGSDIAVFPFSTAHDTSIVPGKYEEDGEIKFNDEIRWTWCNVRKDNADADSWFYVGFEIPYPVTDYLVHGITQYDAYGNYNDDTTEIARIDDKSHPYYQILDIGVPKGLKGDTLRNLRVIVPTAEDIIYDTSVITTDRDNGDAIIGKPGYPGQEDDVANGREIIVFDFYIYDKHLTPEPITVYLGDFNIISNIKIDEDGTLTVDYTHDDDTVFSKRIKWIQGVTLTTGNGEQGGHFKVDYNNGDTPYEVDLTWVKGIEIAENGTVTYTFAGKGDSLTNPVTGIKEVSKLLKWIKEITLDTDSGEFTVNYNNDSPAFNATLDWIKKIQLDDDGTIHFWHTKDDRDEQYVNRLKWVTGVSLSPNTGEFRMNFNYGDPLVRQLDWVDSVRINEETGEIIFHHVNPAVGDSVSDAKLKLITRAETDATGVVTFYTNTGDSFKILNTDGKTEYHIRTVDNVVLASGIEDDKHIQIKYNTDTEPVKIGDSINYIQDMVVRTVDWHLMVLYSDPNHRAIEADLNEAGMAVNIAKEDPRYKYVYNTGPWVNNLTSSNGTLYAPSVYWRDYGTIKDQAGVLVGLNLTQEDIAPYDNVLEFLNNDTRYSNGLTGENNSPGGPSTQGKIVTYANKIEEAKEFYAFDYNKYSWFYLGSISDTGARDVILVENMGTSDQRNKLNSKGLLFSYSKIEYRKEGLPQYWNPTYTFVE